jgi:hypothetical protein
MTKREQVLESSEQSEEQNDKTPRVRLNQELQDMIFLACDWDFLNKTRIVQSDYVKKLTEYSNMESAAKYGNLTNIKYLLNRGSKLDTHVFVEAGGYKGIDSIKNLEWLKSQNCPYDFNLTGDAIKYEAFDNMIWLNKNIQNWNFFDMICAVHMRKFSIVKFMHANGFEWSIGNEFNQLARCWLKLDQIQWLFEKNYPFTSLDELLDDIMKFHDIEVIKWWHNNIQPISGREMNSAARFGTIDDMKWMLENGIRFNNATFFESLVKVGDGLEHMEWLHDMGCGFGILTFDNCYLDPYIVYRIKWLYENGLPLTESGIRRLRRDGCTELVEWLDSILPPFGAKL